MRAFPPFLFIAWSLAAVPLAAADEPNIFNYSEQRRDSVGAGNSVGSILFKSRNDTVEAQFGIVDFTQRDVSAGLVTSLTGPVKSSPLATLGDATGADSIMAIDVDEGLSRSPGIRGMRYQDGRLFAWPADGTQMVLTAEGCAEFGPVNSGSAWLTIDGTTSMTLASVNGVAPLPGGAPVLYTGNLEATSAPAAFWTKTSVALPLNPRRSGQDPHGMLVESRLDRAFLPGALIPGEEVATTNRQAVLLFAPPVPPIIEKAVRENRPITITVDLPARLRLARSVAPVGSVFLKGGGEVETEGSTSLIASNCSTRKLLFMSLPDDTTGMKPIPRADMLKFLAKEGFTDAAWIPSRLPLFLPRVKNARDSRKASAVPARLAMAVLPSVAKLEVPGEQDGLFRVLGVRIEGTGKEFDRNGTRALQDERVSSSPFLTEFWAIPTPSFRSTDIKVGREEAPALKLTLPRSMGVSAIEIVHAEAVGFSPEFDLKGYRILGRDKATDQFRTLLEVKHEKPVARERLELDLGRIRELRIEIDEANFIPAGDVARIAEIILWSREKS